MVNGSSCSVRILSVLFSLFLMLSWYEVSASVSLNIPWNGPNQIKAGGSQSSISSAYNAGQDKVVTVINVQNSETGTSVYQLQSYLCTSTGPSTCTGSAQLPDGAIDASKSSASVIDFTNGSGEQVAAFWISFGASSQGLYMSLYDFSVSQFGSATQIVVDLNPFQFNYTLNSPGPRAIFYDGQITVFLVNRDDDSLYNITSTSINPVTFGNPTPVQVLTQPSDLPIIIDAGDFGVVDSPQTSTQTEMLVLAFGNYTDSSLNVYWAVFNGVDWLDPSFLDTSTAGGRNSWSVSLATFPFENSCPLFIAFYPDEGTPVNTNVTPISLLFNQVGAPTAVAASGVTIKSTRATTGFSFTNSAHSYFLWFWSNTISDVNFIELTVG